MPKMKCCKTALLPLATFAILPIHFRKKPNKGYSIIISLKQAASFLNLQKQDFSRLSMFMSNYQLSTTNHPPLFPTPLILFQKNYFCSSTNFLQERSAPFTTRKRRKKTGFLQLAKAISKGFTSNLASIYHSSNPLKRPVSKLFFHG